MAEQICKIVKTIEDIQEFKRNAIDILRKNSQYATAKATEEAFDALIWLTETCKMIKELEG